MPLPPPPPASWPNDCPACGTRMEFYFAAEVFRQCPKCSARVSAAQAISNARRKGGRK